VAWIKYKEALGLEVKGESLQQARNPAIENFKDSDLGLPEVEDAKGS
jgi:hypothetical protein